MPILVGFLVCGCKTFKEGNDDVDVPSARQVAAKVAELHPPLEEPLPQVATYRYRREISMYYKLELNASKAQITNALGVMRSHDHEIRACYADRLEEVSGLSGDLQISFTLLKSTGLVGNVARTGGSLSDLATINCVTKKLAHMRFNARGDYRGRVRYSFASSDRSPERAPSVLPQMQMPAKAKPALVGPPSSLARPPTQQQQKSEQKEAANQKCSGCKGQDGGKQQAQAVGQKSKNAD